MELGLSFGSSQRQFLWSSLSRFIQSPFSAQAVCLQYTEVTLIVNLSLTIRRRQRAAFPLLRPAVPTSPVLKWARWPTPTSKTASKNPDHHVHEHKVLVGWLMGLMDFYSAVLAVRRTHCACSEHLEWPVVNRRMMTISTICISPSIENKMYIQTRICHFFDESGWIHPRFKTAVTRPAVVQPSQLHVKRWKSQSRSTPCCPLLLLTDDVTLPRCMLTSPYALLFAEHQWDEQSWSQPHQPHPNYPATHSLLIQQLHP